MKKIFDSKFQSVVRLAPLISVDLLIIDPRDCCLLGKRNNPPAKGSMFVPGGRILKNEKIIEAVNRVLLCETGHTISEGENITFTGVFEHFYNDSYWDSSTSTHYVVIAYRIDLVARFTVESDNQHTYMEWVPCNEIVDRGDVHENVKTYFK
ncbi:MAG: NUDIX domain-containing protein [Pseudomonadota bacterium]|nr:NUDIX domain-containing protein [Pseudomonadota bacterium]